MVRLLLDVDGVIADFNGLYMKIAEQVLGVSTAMHQPLEWDIGKSLGLTEEQNAKVYEFINAPGSASQILPLPGAVEAVRAIATTADVYFVTSPIKTSPTWAYDRQQWLRQHFGDELGKKVISTNHKHTVTGDVFLDDKPDNVRRWSNNWPNEVLGLGLLWNQPYNSKETGLLRAFSWKDISNYCRFMFLKSPRIHVK